MITEYQIEMIVVDDADAFVVYYVTDDKKEHLVLIDAGRYGNGERVLNHLNKHYEGIPVELAIVTHPDEDHFGGFIYLLEQIRDHSENAVPIRRFWINDPRNHFSKKDVKGKINQKELDERLKSVYMVDGKNLLELIESLKICHDEVFAITLLKLKVDSKGNRYLKSVGCKPSDQEGFTVLGPLCRYYEKQSEDFRYNGVVRIKETKEEDEILDEPDFVQTDDCYSRVLDDAYNDTSCHNKSSLIILFQPYEGRKYLFTGDASVDSFNAMRKSHQKLCKDVYWMKVPHHGSKHNLNTDWIRFFNPQIAYISTAKIGKFLNQCTINALKKNGCKIVSTHLNQDATYIVHHDCMARDLCAVEVC